MDSTFGRPSRSVPAEAALPGRDRVRLARVTARLAERIERACHEDAEAQALAAAQLGDLMDEEGWVASDLCRWVAGARDPDAIDAWLSFRPADERRLHRVAVELGQRRAAVDEQRRTARRDAQMSAVDVPPRKAHHSLLYGMLFVAVIVLVLFGATAIAP